MSERLGYFNLFPEGFKKLVEIGGLLDKGTLDHKILELVKLRASQMNECTYCVDMHVKEAIIAKESHLRLHHVAVWKESKLFSERERAALLWTEALTRLSFESTNDKVYAEVKKHFDDKELVQLSLAIAVINSWNRFGVAFRAQHGSRD